MILADFWELADL